MRLRSSSIRAKVIALLMVPIVALTALWVYATLVTTGDVWTQFEVSSSYRSFGATVDQYAHDLQNERRTAVQKLADPRSQPAAEAFDKARATTDREAQALRAKVGTAEARKLDATQQARFREVLASYDQVVAVRDHIERSMVSWTYILDQYSDLIKPTFAFRSAFVSRQSGQLPRQGTILIELVRAREYLAQEDAAMGGLSASTAKISPQQYQAALDALHNQRALFTVYIAELETADRTDYLALRTGENWSALERAERDFTNAAGYDRVAEAINGDDWHAVADRALGDLDAINARLAGGIDARADSYAMGLLWRGGIAGAIGLAAIVLSIVISYRIGRGMAREMIGLRNAAQELAANRLPSVMLRLRRGEPVDIAAETPELQFGPAEAGQVGRAINAVQRAAVEAAVEQAELRRGVSAVFVNLARRSQVLLHRQLTLLDTMERRTEDPAELEDLFRLDHLTTRMRRHAEGLIILSGGSPGRAWRKPVRMVDVVRAAVGEVEDYARVIVRPFPGTGLLGSAVADVTHLIAELVENAAVFSPPQTQVTVQGEVVAHGFALEIDDRGLGLSSQALADINQRLSVEQEFDLADTDRLGLFVVSRLARRHGIRVHLRPSPYGGTTAVVLIPRELLAEAPDVMSEQPAAPAPVQARTAPAAGARRGQRELVAVPALAETGPHGRHAGPDSAAEEPDELAGRRGGPRPSVAEPAREPGGLPRRRAGGPVLVPAPAADGSGRGRHRRDEGPDPESEPASAPAAGTPGGGRQGAGLPGSPLPGGGLLPRRVRQANLAPQLKEAAQARAAAAPGAAPAEPARERSPEEARATFASFQRGFTRGRGDRARPGSLTAVPSPAAPPAPVAPAPASPALFDPWAGSNRRALTPGHRPAALPAAPAGPAALTGRRPVVPASPVPPVASAPPASPSPSPSASSAPPAPAEGTDS
ncbi:nitrate- and nitrite sensing domain-containing protein [Kitasatospora herbaricolor]|uniref:histidine kinase n=1 Tax=Kitasatospora herbaricolor TaxID=68217 RepID=A0ABZ1W4X2_9ACTN|nr:nitrate- and nitrite sensing domain-containing protein [Kitasatospora herbaricolor]